MKILLLLLLLVIDVQAKQPEELTPYSKITDLNLIPENSALFKSKKFKDVFWTLNDSGNTPNIYALNSYGQLITPVLSSGKYKGISVTGANNKDWEALTGDDKGNLIICDSGNNKNKRKKLAVYIVPEPNPYTDVKTVEAKKIEFAYPDQKDFPPKQKNFDSEACFYFEGKLYLLTKHRSDTFTKLYMFKKLDFEEKEILHYAGKFDAGAMVTGAAISDDENKLAILTYEGVYLFENIKGKKNIFSVKPLHYVFSAGQCEGITFETSDTLIIANEDNSLYRIKTSSFK